MKDGSGEGLCGFIYEIYFRPIWIMLYCQLPKKKMFMSHEGTRGANLEKNQSPKWGFIGWCHSHWSILKVF